MLHREITPGDAFIVNFENMSTELNNIAPIIKKLKDKGYKWAFWFKIGDEYENKETILKVIKGDFTGFEDIDAKSLTDWNYAVDTVITNWP